VPLLGCEENLYANFYPTFGGGGQSALCFIVLLLGYIGKTSYSVQTILEGYHFILSAGPEHGLVIINYSKYLWGKENTECKSNEINY
jgi:hypothetical protein